MIHKYLYIALVLFSMAGVGQQTDSIKSVENVSNILNKLARVQNSEVEAFIGENLKAQEDAKII